MQYFVFFEGKKYYEGEKGKIKIELNMENRKCFIICDGYLTGLMT